VAAGGIAAAKIMAWRQWRRHQGGDGAGVNENVAWRRQMAAAKSGAANK